jgi:hypothetical protein
VVFEGDGKRIGHGSRKGQWSMVNCQL